MGHRSPSVSKSVDLSDNDEEAFEDAAFGEDTIKDRAQSHSSPSQQASGSSHDHISATENYTVPQDLALADYTWAASHVNKIANELNVVAPTQREIREFAGKDGLDTLRHYEIACLAVVAQLHHHDGRGISKEQAIANLKALQARLGKHGAKVRGWLSTTDQTAEAKTFVQAALNFVNTTFTEGDARAVKQRANAINSTINVPAERQAALEAVRPLAAQVRAADARYYALLNNEFLGKKLTEHPQFKLGRANLTLTATSLINAARKGEDIRDKLTALISDLNESGTRLLDSDGYTYEGRTTAEKSLVSELPQRVIAALNALKVAHEALWKARQAFETTYGNE